MATPRIFVSHSSSDAVWCTQFVESLKSAGADVWFDATGLSVGAQWVQTIEFELQDREVFLVILTPDAWESKWVRDEITLALQQHKSIIGLIHRPVKVSGFITNYQMLNIVGRSAEQAAQQVLKELGIVLQPRAPRQPASNPASQPTIPQPNDDTTRLPPPSQARSARQSAQSARGTTTHAAASAAPSSTASLVTVQPRTIDFGQLKQGQRGTVSVTVRGQNGASVNGQIISLTAWITVDRSSFSGPSTDVQVIADTTRINSTGKQYSSLQFVTGTQHIYLPVTAEIVRAPRATTAPQSSASYVTQVEQPLQKKRKWWRR